jgi:hypothetical protein
MKSVVQVLLTFFISLLFCASLKAQTVNEGYLKTHKMIIYQCFIYQPHAN